MRILIIGGGPGGYTAALESAKNNADVTIISDELGGECLHRGCIPTKYFLENRIDAKNCESFLTQLHELIGSTENGIAYLLKKSNVNFICGRAVMNEDREILVDSNTVPYDFLILATGSQPIIQNLLQNDSYVIHDAMEIMKTPNTLPKEISILGAGSSGLELAVIMHNLGCRVYVQEAESEILSGADKEMASRLRRILTEAGISFHMNCKKPACRDVILCSGRKPVLPDGAEFLCNINGRIEINQLCQTKVSNIFAIGDCTGIGMEATTAKQQALKVINSLFDKKAFDFYPSAHCIFTKPNLAWVGLANPDDCAVRVSFDTLSSCRIADYSYGLLKMFFNSENGVISSIHILSNQASLLISTAQLICQTKMTVMQLKNVIFPHPTAAEIFQEAAVKAEKKYADIKK